MSGVADVVRTENTITQNGVGTRDGGGSEPLVSVIIPAFQCAQYIAQAIESVLSQSYSNLEIVVVNDGSPDKSILKARLFMKEPISGSTSARFRFATGVPITKSICPEWRASSTWNAARSTM